MRINRWLTTVFSIGVILGVPAWSHAGSITVSFGGICPAIGGTTPSVDIHGACGNVTITNGMVVGDDSEGDSLSMQGVKIQATGGPVEDFPIMFSADFVQPPCTDKQRGTAVSYEIYVSGSLTRGNNQPKPALNDSIKVKGIITDPSINGLPIGIGLPFPRGADISKQIDCVDLGCEKFTGSANSSWRYLSCEANPTNKRTLTGQLLFSLAYGDYLILDTIGVHDIPTAKSRKRRSQ